MKKIIVPTDFSENALNAAKYAIGLANDIDAEVILYHTYKTPMPILEIPTLPTTFADMKKANKESLKKLAEKLDSKRITGYESDDHSFLEGLARLVKNENADFVVMGTQGASGLKKALIGTNTADVINKIPVPVLAVPEHAKYKPIQKVIYATDYEFTDLEQIEWLIDQFPSQPEIMLSHISVEDEKNEDPRLWFNELVVEKIKYPNFLFKLIAGSDFEKALDKLVDDTKADLLVFSTLKRNLFQRLFIKSTTEMMVMHTHIPFLAMHHDAEKPMKRLLDKAEYSK